MYKKEKQPAKRRSRPIGISDIVEKLRSTSSGNNDQQTQLVGMWRQAIDNQALLENSEPSRIEESTLYVLVSAPAWAARIRLSTPSLLESLRRVGLQGVDKLEVKVIPGGLSSQ